MNRASTREHPLQSDSVCSALADEHRRAILTELHDSGESALGLTDLANRVAERVADDGPPGPDTRGQVQVTLHHRHLPRLADAGLIVYDVENRQVWNAVGQPTREILGTLDSPAFSG